MSELSQKILSESRRIVIKIGSRILVDSARGGVRAPYIQKLAASVSKLMDAGKEVVIVSSGAVGTAGLRRGGADRLDVRLPGNVPREERVRGPDSPFR